MQPGNRSIVQYFALGKATVQDSVNSGWFFW